MRDKSAISLLNIAAILINMSRFHMHDKSAISLLNIAAILNNVSPLPHAWQVGHFPPKHRCYIKYFKSPIQTLKARHLLAGNGKLCE